MIQGDKVRVINDIPSINGMLRKDTVVKIDDIIIDTDSASGNIRVIDNLGKIWWVRDVDIDNV